MNSILIESFNSVSHNISTLISCKMRSEGADNPPLVPAAGDPKRISMPAGLSFQAPDNSGLQNGFLPFPITMDLITDTLDGTVSLSFEIWMRIANPIKELRGPQGCKIQRSLQICIYPTPHWLSEKETVYQPTCRTRRYLSITVTCHDGARTPQISLLDNGSGTPQTEDDDLNFISPSLSTTLLASRQVTNKCCALSLI